MPVPVCLTEFVPALSASAQPGYFGATDLAWNCNRATKKLSDGNVSAAVMKSSVSVLQHLM